MAASDSWSSPNSYQVPELRVVLLGTTGAGKSSTGKLLLGAEKFQSSSTRTSCTRECCVAEVDRFGARLVVVDTPGVLDTGMSEKDLKVMLKECTHFACPGVHAFLFLMKIGERDIGRRDKRTFDLLTTMFGEKFLDHTIVVFTAKDCLGDDTLDQFVSGLPDPCKAFLNSCNGGFLAVENLRRDEQEQAANCKQIVDQVKDLHYKNGGRYYKNILFDKENEEIRKRMEHILKIQNPRDRIKARLAANDKINFEKTVEKIMTGAAVAGGTAAAVATGGFAAVAAVGGSAVLDIAGPAVVATTVGVVVKKIGSAIVRKIRSD